MIRLMREKDLEAVAELEKICFSQSWSWNLLESGLHSPYDEYYVFEQNGELLGYCNLRVLAGEGEIERICVRPGSRRLGVGRKLMEEMERSARGQGVVRMMLEVREGNEAARRLYESFGFGAIAVRKNYYHDPLENAVIMGKG